MILIVYGVLVVCAAGLAAVAGLTLVQCLVPSRLRQHRSNDAAGAIYHTLGVVCAVLLGLVVIAVWEEYGTADETVESEANALDEIAWLAHGLPEPDGLQLQKLARSSHKRWSKRSGRRWSRGEWVSVGGTLSTTSG